MESTLQGKKGQKDVLVDNLGKVIKTVKTTKASAGNNVYRRLMQIYKNMHIIF